VSHFGSEAAFLEACTEADAMIFSIQCAELVESAMTGKATVAFVGPNEGALVQLLDWLADDGIVITEDVMLYPPGSLTTNSPTSAPVTTTTTAPVECAAGENLVTVDVKVGYFYDATITQLWSLAGYKCEHMSGYMESDFGQYTTHTKQCCLPAASYTLTCSSGPTFGWKGGNVKINGETYCDSDALKTTVNYVETQQVDLCSGNCAPAPESFVQMQETCENGFVPSISMAVGSVTESSASGITWQLSDACSGGNYSPKSGEHHDYHDVACCLPKGKYTLTCGTTGVHSWQNSFVLINGRQYCYNSDGGEAHVIDMCDGVSECPDFTTNEQGSTGSGNINVGGLGDVSVGDDGEIFWDDNDLESDATALGAAFATAVTLLALFSF